MSREVPIFGLHCYNHRSWFGWCYGSRCEGWHWNHQNTGGETELIPCKRRPPDWLVGIPCWEAQPEPSLAALEDHWLAFGVGKWPLLIHKQGLWSSHLLHKPCCSLHRPFVIQAVPVIIPNKQFQFATGCCIQIKQNQTECCIQISILQKLYYKHTLI